MVSVFILPYETMYTIQDIVDSLNEETRIINHLFTKIPFGKEEILQYRPNSDQRSLIELLDYMMMMGNAISSVLVKGSYDPEILKPFKDALKDVDVQKDFPAVMEQQAKDVAERVAALSAEAMEESIDPFGGGAWKRKTYILDVMLKTYTAYRMQLFLYLKDSGERGLNTANVWQGRDME